MNNIELLLVALHDIAAFDDTSANERLEKTGSFGAFDEPGSVEIAREALEKYRLTARIKQTLIRRHSQTCVSHYANGGRLEDPSPCDCGALISKPNYYVSDGHESENEIASTPGGIK